MDCKEFEKLIPDFLAQKLDFLTMKQFQEHKEKCPGCSEELEIQFLVAEGMQRLEEGDAFDLERELKYHLTEAERKVKFHTRFLRIGAVLEGITVVLLGIGMIWILAG